MKKDSAILEAEITEPLPVPDGQEPVAHSLGITFRGAKTATPIPIEIRPEAVEPQARVTEGNTWLIVRDFVKPTFSNLVLLGCLLGLFFLYCCSCIINALSFSSRNKTSQRRTDGKASRFPPAGDFIGAFRVFRRKLFANRMNHSLDAICEVRTRNLPHLAPQANTVGPPQFL